MIIESKPIIKVGMADLRAIAAPGILKTSGLGSCVGICLFDPVHKIAGLAHVMLPSSEIARENVINVAKYADTAIPFMIDEMIRLGAELSNMQAKMAGGAQMFVLGSSDMMRIGPRNIESCKMMLNKYNIPLLGEDTGGNYGRTVEIDSSDGTVLIRSVQNGVRRI
jgi:chemotaxis protein CheD